MILSAVPLFLITMDYKQHTSERSTFLIRSKKSSVISQEWFSVNMECDERRERAVKALTCTPNDLTTGSLTTSGLGHSLARISKVLRLLSILIQ